MTSEAVEVLARKLAALPPGPDSLAPIERYARATVDIPGGGIEAGIQYERGRGPGPEWYRRGLKEIINRAAADVMHRRPAHLAPLDANLSDDITAEIERQMLAWLGKEQPRRGWFVEVWRRRPGADPADRDADECLTQVYAPCGMPRVR